MYASGTSIGIITSLELGSKTLLLDKSNIAIIVLHCYSDTYIKWDSVYTFTDHMQPEVEICDRREGGGGISVAGLPGCFLYE